MQRWRKLTAIVEDYEKVPPQFDVCFKYTVVPTSEKSIEDIVSEVEPVVNQAKELADV
jgi:hypothetical protein